MIINKAYFSDMTVENINFSQFYHKMAAKASWHRNCVTVTQCILMRTNILQKSLVHFSVYCRAFLVPEYALICVVKCHILK